MKQLFASALFASVLAAGVVATSPAQAAPVQSGFQPGAASVTLVSGGCGPYGHRDRAGYCRPNRPPPPRYCPRFTHPTPYGCRRN